MSHNVFIFLSKRNHRSFMNIFTHLQIVEVSGWGWEHFGIRSSGTVGELFPIQRLDYENPQHRQGFRFMIQVTDKVSKRQ